MHVDPATSRRILMTADAVGGVWQYSVDLAKAFTSRGAEMLIACLGPGPSQQQKQQLAGTSIALVEKPYALEWMNAAGNDVRASGEWLLKLADQFQPDIVHLNGYAHAALPWRAPVLIAAHSCTATWWQAVHGCAAGNEWNRYRAAVALGLASADMVVAPSAAMAAALASEHPVERGKLRVVHNFSSVPVAPAPVKHPVCLAAGRIWDQAKNLRLLESIAPQLEWPVEVAGSSRSPDNHGAVSAGVTLLAEIPHHLLLKRMQSSSIFVHPALYEPFGLSVLEAARSHCCLVLADIPSLRELWSGCAQFADPRDPEHWLFELNRLIADRQEREKLATRAATHSLRYAEAATVEGYLGCYRDISKPAKGAAA